MSSCRILSISGGGIRGLIPSRILLELETRLRNKLNKNDAKIADYFDLITGTSVGTIIAAILLTPTAYTHRIQSGGQKVGYDAGDLLAFFQLDGSKIFSESYMHWISSMAGYKGPYYSSTPLENLLNEYTATTTLSQLRRNVIFTSWNAKGYPMMFTNLPLIPEQIQQTTTMPIMKTFLPEINVPLSPLLLTRKREDKGVADVVVDDFYLKDVVRAATAAPTYFPAGVVKGIHSGQTTPFTILDGGVIINNPTMYAMMEMIKRGKSIERMFVLSLGCGFKSMAIENSNNYGKIDWINPVINIAIDGNDELTNDMATAMLNPNNYFRINPTLVTANASIDDASQKNLGALQKDAETWIAENGKILDAIINRIVYNMV